MSGTHERCLEHMKYWITNHKVMTAVVLGMPDSPAVLSKPCLNPTWSRGRPGNEASLNPT